MGTEVLFSFDNYHHSTCRRCVYSGEIKEAVSMLEIALEWPKDGPKMLEGGIFHPMK